MKTKFIIFVLLFCNVIFAKTNTLPPALTIFYSGSPGCAVPGNLLDVEFIEDLTGVDPGDDIPIDYSNGVYSSTPGLVIDPTTGQIDAGASTAGTYVVKYRLPSSYTLSTTVKIRNPITPTFNPIGAVCKGGTAPILPTLSLNGVNGRWSPRVIDTSTFGTKEYSFIPNDGQCASPTSILINITTAQVTPTFNPIRNTYCLNDTAQILPTTSTNGIVGTWAPSIINTSTVGFTTYKFVASSGECIDNVTFDVTINPIIPDFQDIILNTNYQAVPTLPTTSPNGITGTWSPAVINLAVSSIYTFTPNNGQCGTQKIISVVKNYPNASVPPVLQVCGNSFGNNSFKLSNNNSLINTNPNPNLYKVEYFEYPYQAQSTSDFGKLNDTDYRPNGSNVTIYARVSNINNPFFHSVVPVVLQANSILQPIITSDNNLLNVYLDASGNVIQPVTLRSNLQGNYRYVWTRDNVTVADSSNGSYVINTFTGLNSPKQYKLTVYNSNNPNCNGVSNTITINQIRVPAPSGPDNQNFIPGQTLANLVVTGSNIRWYSTNIPSPATLLPLSTLLTNGAIYFATQTIAGVESQEVLGVIAISPTLSNTEFNFIDLKYSPNPFSDVLNIQSQETIKNITVLNVFGQEVYNRQYNNAEIKLDLSNLTSGNYFARIESDNKSQVIKVIKK
jgi:hypothetical protein